MLSFTLLTIWATAPLSAPITFSPTTEFVFKDNPLELRQWEILDQKKKSITVTLYEVELNKDLKSNLFKYEEYDLFDKD